jgi:ribonuclease P protein component
MATMDHKAPKHLRLTRRSDIARLFAEGRRASNHALVLAAVPNALAVSRLGVGVSSRHGSAVRRNRVKRLCREAFRLIRDELPAGWDFMMMPRAGHEVTLGGLQSSLRTLAAKATAAEAPGHE